jgi:hypothetical protein
MWMKLVQFVLFAVGLFLPFVFLPHPLPPNVDAAQIGVFALACGVALAFLGTVGISHLFSTLRRRGARQRRASACTESVAGRVQALPKDRLL